MKKRPHVDLGNAEIVERDNYIQTLKEILDGGFCPFCEEHLSKHHKRPFLYKSTYWIVTENSWPYEGSKFHFLFIARPHVEKMENLPSPMWAELLKLYQQLVVEKRLRGATLMIRSGDTKISGASVNHLHAHLFVGVRGTKKTRTIAAVVGFKK